MYVLNKNDLPECDDPDFSEATILPHDAAISLRLQYHRG